MQRLKLNLDPVDTCWMNAWWVNEWMQKWTNEVLANSLASAWAQLASARMWRQWGFWCSTTQTPTIAATEAGQLCTSLFLAMTWRSWRSWWAEVPRWNPRMPMASPPYLWPPRVGNWRRWDSWPSTVSAKGPWVMVSPKTTAGKDRRDQLERKASWGGILWAYSDSMVGSSWSAVLRRILKLCLGSAGNVLRSTSDACD